ncbi:unnamed protein product [Prorocentrum cordatum]|uniref:Uncharacterized protein n=1 Tax=Prorocentrum cordatum TaxID=2364126 RepID=A0ABN9T4J2_9DINO|nr:unnamed protein product [Polarella glacialis]
MSTRPWHIYLPHWSVQERALGGPKGVTLRALQETFLKASTALSWELGDEDRLYVRPLAELQAVRVGEVLDPAERARHSGSPDHRVVELTQASEGAALAGDALWFVCRAFGLRGPTGGRWRRGGAPGWRARAPRTRRACRRT